MYIIFCIYIYIYPHKRVSSFPGLISVAFYVIFTPFLDYFGGFRVYLKLEFITKKNNKKWKVYKTTFNFALQAQLLEIYSN